MAGFIYFIFYIIKRSHIQNLAPIIMGIIGSYSIAKMLGLTMFAWMIEKVSMVLAIFIIIVFQNEIRRASERIRRGSLFSAKSKTGQKPLLIKRILQSVEFLANQKIGALIVIERSSELDEYAESGIAIRANLTTELLCSLFWPGSPTHDGAVIIRGNEITTAGCLLPLTKSKLSDKRLGTRHMSAIGMSEESDAFIIIVSEETGAISIAEDGNLTRFLNREALETCLFNIFKFQKK